MTSLAGLTNFAVGVTNNSPASVTPQTDAISFNYPVCRYINGSQSLPIAVYECYPGPLDGRYVIIQGLESVATTLSLCEVNIFMYGE